MARIKSLYDAIIKYQSGENQCTNFLVWLLEKLPNKIMAEICKKSKLSIGVIEGKFSMNVQYTLDDSTADALVEFPGRKYLLIETKLSPNSFDRDQFIRHFKGGTKEFGAENIWILFLSGDEDTPSELKELEEKHDGRVGFISWKSIFQLIEDNKNSLSEKYEIIIEEFKTFTKHYLRRIIIMNNGEAQKFIEYYHYYPYIAINEKAALEKFSEIIIKMQKQIIMECEGLVEENTTKNDDTVNNLKKLPCLMRCLKIKGWHTEESAYIFLNILKKEIGVVLTGYEKNSKEKGIFLEQWNRYLKNKYKDDPKLVTFTWEDDEYDESAFNGGYLKIVNGMSGKSFSPDKFSDFAVHFYWGYIYEFDIEKIQKSYYGMIAKDFKKLLNTFGNNNKTQHYARALKRHR